MPRSAPIVTRSRMCWLCKGAQRSSYNVDKHCERCHSTMFDIEDGKPQPSGFIWKRMSEDSNRIVALKADHPGINTRNVMYCFDCKRMYETDSHNPLRHFEAHSSSNDQYNYTCSPHGTAKPSKRKGLILGPRKKEAMPTTTVAPAPVRTDGMWLDEALYNSLRAKYPAVGTLDPFKDGKEGQVFDATTFLNAIGKEVTEAEKYQKAYRQSQTAVPTPTAATAATDSWEAVVKELLGDKDLGDRMDELYEAEKESYQADYKDYFNIKDEDDDDEDEEADDTIQHVTDEGPPDANIYRRAIKTALLHSTKIGSISTMAKKQAAAEVAKKQREIDDITKELVDLRREVATLRSRS